jgi:hypothetical protein
MASIEQQHRLIEFLRKYRSPFLLFSLIKAGRFPNERAVLGIILLAMHSGHWPTSLAALLGLRDRAILERTRHEAALVEYRMIQQFNLFRILISWGEEAPLEEPKPESLLLIFGDPSDSEILSGLRDLEAAGFISMCDDSIVTPTDKFFETILAGCREQAKIFKEDIPD